MNKGSQFHDDNWLAFLSDLDFTPVPPISAPIQTESGLDILTEDGIEILTE